MFDMKLSMSRDVYIRETGAAHREMNSVPKNIMEDCLLVGIMGCGRLGNEIANCLLIIGKLKPAQLYISTRRPEHLGCWSNNTKCHHLVYWQIY